MKTRILLLSGMFALTSFYAQAQSNILRNLFLTDTTALTTGSAVIRFYSGSTANSSLRWIFGEIGLESGNNAGSNFRLFAYGDNGVYLRTALAINRFTGLVEMPGGFRGNNGSGIAGDSTGPGATSFISFYETGANGVRHGYMGKGSKFNPDIYVGSDIAGVRLNAADGSVHLAGNGTRNTLDFYQSGFGVPTFTNRSVGTRLVLHGSVAATSVDYAMGLDTLQGTHAWISIPTNSTAHFWRVYGGTTEVAKLDGVGNFSIAGNATIGTTTTQVTMRVNGTINARKIEAVTTGWPDYVFGKNYELPSLQQVSAYIKEHQHLPNMPAAEEVEKNGLDIVEMQKKMMEKIEELTLHLIRLDEENRQLKAEVEKMKASK